VEPVGGALVGMKGWRKYHGVGRKCGRIGVLKRAATMESDKGLVRI
jgi:hypothetical protein